MTQRDLTDAGRLTRRFASTFTLIAACTVGLLTRGGRAEARLAVELGWRTYTRLRAEAQWRVRHWHDADSQPPTTEPPPLTPEGREQRGNGTAAHPPVEPPLPAPLPPPTEPPFLDPLAPSPTAPPLPPLSPVRCAAVYWSSLRTPDILRIRGHLSATDLSAKLRADPIGTRKRYRGLVATYNAALSQLEDYEGIVKRKIRIPPSELEEFLNNHKRGMAVVYEGFTHTTGYSQVPKEYTGNVLLVILSRHGKHVAPWSRYPVEDNEVAFALGTTFRVIDAYKAGDLHIIDLAEIAED